MLTDLIVPYFTLVSKGFEIECRVKLNGQDVSVTDNEIDSSLLFFYNENSYLWQKVEDVNPDEVSCKGDGLLH